MYIISKKLNTSCHFSIITYIFLSLTNLALATVTWIQLQFGEISSLRTKGQSVKILHCTFLWNLEIVSCQGLDPLTGRGVLCQLSMGSQKQIKPTLVPGAVISLFLMLHLFKLVSPNLNGNSFENVTTIYFQLLSQLSGISWVYHFQRKAAWEVLILEWNIQST